MKICSGGIVREGYEPLPAPCKIYDANDVEIERVIEADTNTGLVLKFLPNSFAKVYEYRPFPLKVVYADEDDTVDE